MQINDDIFSKKKKQILSHHQVKPAKETHPPKLDMKN